MERTAQPQPFMVFEHYVLVTFDVVTYIVRTIPGVAVEHTMIERTDSILRGTKLMLLFVLITRLRIVLVE